MRRVVTMTVVVAMAASPALADGAMRITEWMYSGANLEYIEFTNVGDAPVDMTDWSYDDVDDVPGAVDLSGIGVVAVGESVILAESSAADFRAAWGLAPTVKVVGGSTHNLARNDTINLYDDADALIDRLTYGDQDFPGSIRTQNRSGNPITPAALGANDCYQWELALDGDVYGSYTSTGGDIGNPGKYVPEPGSLALLLLGAGLGWRRR